MSIARIATATLAFASAQAFAHGGHGAASASHWHATDTFGLIAVALLAGCAWLASRGGR